MAECPDEDPDIKPDVMNDDVDYEQDDEQEEGEDDEQEEGQEYEDEDGQEDDTQDALDGLGNSQDYADDSQAGSDDSDETDIIKQEVFQCEHCGKSYRGEGMLRRHVKAYHPDPDDSPPPPRRARSKFGRKRGRKPTKKVVARSRVDYIDENRFPCPHCNKAFQANSALRRHAKQFHPDVDMPPCKRAGPKGKAPLEDEAMVKCSSCDKTFFNKYSASRHEAMAHDIIKKKPKGSGGDGGWRCRGCDMTFPNKCALSKHELTDHKASLDSQFRPRLGAKTGTDALVKCKSCNLMFLNKCAASKHEAMEHKVDKMPPGIRREMIFDNMDEFLKWKTDEEDATLTRYVKARKDKARINGEVRRTYVCHRSGFYRRKGHGLRHLKVQGSAKIGAICPASILVKMPLHGKVIVIFYPEHKGHDAELAHIPMRREQREQIATMLAAGVPVEDILNKNQLNLGNGEVSYVRSASSKDLQNVMRDFNISKGIVLHRNNAAGVEVNEVQNCKATAEQHWSYICSAIETNGDVASSICEELARVKDLVVAFQSKPELVQRPVAAAPVMAPVASTSVEMINKRPAAQPRQPSAQRKRKPKRQKMEVMLQRPDPRERKYLYTSLIDGQVAGLPQHLTETDHYYDIAASDFFRL